MSMNIKQGYTGLTGRFVKHGWTLNIPGEKPLAFGKLASAKAFARECGASGKWTRSTGIDGPRTVIVYDEVQA